MESKSADEVITFPLLYFSIDDFDQRFEDVVVAPEQCGRWKTTIYIPPCNLETGLCNYLNVLEGTGGGAKNTPH